ncbi:hypothetical protein MKW92_037290 [Papaver armeniacum]|nr:hypothetical protein MKW92_037290 [Papaver armeniacum]
MSSLRNSVPRRAHKERSQPKARKKFGILEKPKDYRQRAKAYHTKENIIKILKEKAANKNPDEFYYNMIRSKTVDGVHIPESEAKFTQDQLMLMKTQDMGYIKQKWQIEEKKIERLSSMLHSLGDQMPNKHVYFAEDREEAKEIQSNLPSHGKLPSQDIPAHIKSPCAGKQKYLIESWKHVKKRANELKMMYMEMALKKELQKKGRKRKLREDEIVSPTSGPVYKWRTERKR